MASDNFAGKEVFYLSYLLIRLVCRPIRCGGLVVSATASQSNVAGQFSHFDGLGVKFFTEAGFNSKDNSAVEWTVRNSHNPMALNLGSRLELQNLLVVF